MRFLHLADLHLDTPFTGRSEELRRRLRAALRATLRAAVDRALAERLDAVVVAGDLFDGERVSFESERLLRSEVERLTAAGIPFLYATGNHDPAPTFAQRTWPAGVEIFSSATPRCVDVRPRGGPTVGRVTGAGHEHACVTDNLAARFPVAARPDGLPEVALLHAAIQGVEDHGGDDHGAENLGGSDYCAESRGAESRGAESHGAESHGAEDAAGHARYAPGTLKDLRGRGYDYWALGHVHRRHALCDDPPSWYAGCPQGRTPAEHGPRGGNLVTLQPGYPAQVEFVPLGPLAWQSLGLSGFETTRSLDALLAALIERLREHLPEAPREGAHGQPSAGELPARNLMTGGIAGVEPAPGIQATVQPRVPEGWLLRLRLRGGCPLHRELREPENQAFVATELMQEFGLVDLELDCAGLGPVVDLATARARRDVLGEALRLLEAARTDPVLRETLAPPELAGAPTEPAARAAYLAALLDDAEPALLTLLLEDGA